MCRTVGGVGRQGGPFEWEAPEGPVEVGEQGCAARALGIARQALWVKAGHRRPHYRGLERGVDEAATTKLYRRLVRRDYKRAGALHTILADGVWTPSRARKRAKREDDRCVACGRKGADADHLWWDCPCLHSKCRFHFADLRRKRARDKGQLKCL